MAGAAPSYTSLSVRIPRRLSVDGKGHESLSTDMCGHFDIGGQRENDTPGTRYQVLYNTIPVNHVQQATALNLKHQAPFTTANCCMTISIIPVFSSPDYIGYM